MADKLISQLPLGAAILDTDIFPDVQQSGLQTVQITAAQLATYMQGKLQLGAVVTFTAGQPQNTAGKNGDVAINTVSGQISMKVSGTYVVQYTFPVGLKSVNGFLGDVNGNVALTTDQVAQGTTNMYFTGSNVRAVTDPLYLPLTGAKPLTGVLNANKGIDVDGTTGNTTLSIGTNNATVINIGNSGAIINLIANKINEQAVTNLGVSDKLITLNNNGPAGSGNNVGFQIWENAVYTGYFTTTADRNGYMFQAPGLNFPGTLDFSLLTTARTLKFPDSAGTIATQQYIAGLSYATTTQLTAAINAIPPITAANINSALGYTAYNGAANASGFITSSALSPYATTSALNTAISGVKPTLDNVLTNGAISAQAVTIGGLTATTGVFSGASAFGGALISGVTSAEYGTGEINRQVTGSAAGKGANYSTWYRGAAQMGAFGYLDTTTDILYLNNTVGAVSVNGSVFNQAGGLTVPGTLTAGTFNLSSSNINGNILQCSDSAAPGASVRAGYNSYLSNDPQYLGYTVGIGFAIYSASYGSNIKGKANLGITASNGLIFSVIGSGGTTAQPDTTFPKVAFGTGGAGGNSEYAKYAANSGNLMLFPPTNLGTDGAQADSGDRLQVYGTSYVSGNGAFGGSLKAGTGLLGSANHILSSANVTGTAANLYQILNIGTSNQISFFAEGNGYSDIGFNVNTLSSNSGRVTNEAGYSQLIRADKAAGSLIFYSTQATAAAGAAASFFASLILDKVGNATFSGYISGAGTIKTQATSSGATYNIPVNVDIVFAAAAGTINLPTASSDKAGRIITIVRQIGFTGAVTISSVSAAALDNGTGTYVASVALGAAGAAMSRLTYINNGGGGYMLLGTI